MFTYVLLGLGYGLGAAAQPGPFQTYVVSQTLRIGWRRALAAAFAPLISDGPIIVLSFLVLNRMSVRVQFPLYVVGGMFSLYLAWGAWNSWHSFDEVTMMQPSTAEQGILKAALVNLLSPGPYLYWGLVTGPILAAGWRETPARGIGFLCGFYGAMTITLTILIVVFGTVRRLGPRVTRALLGVSAISLTGFGLLQIWKGIGGLL